MGKITGNTPKAAKNSNNSEVKILLAEDNEINRKLAIILLERKGWQVSTVKNGLEALEAFQDQEFALVLMDVQMPGMNGLEATKAIRNLEKLNGDKYTPIVAMTAYAMQGDKEMCLEAGMDDYVSKPINKEELYSVIAKSLMEVG